jgi:hypothetical protein
MATEGECQRLVEKRGIANVHWCVIDDATRLAPRDGLWGTTEGSGVASGASVSDYYIRNTYETRPVGWQWQQDCAGRRISRKGMNR